MGQIRRPGHSRREHRAGPGAAQQVRASTPDSRSLLQTNVEVASQSVSPIDLGMSTERKAKMPFAPCIAECPGARRAPSSTHEEVALDAHTLRHAMDSIMLKLARPWRHRRPKEAPVCTCQCPVPHKVFVTEPPGYGSLLECHGDHRHGIAVTIGIDGMLRDLDGGHVRPGRRPSR